jgi:DNA-directed RNA polymerase subunit beta
MNNSAFITTLPDFIEIQRASFCWFLSKGLSEELANFSVIEDLTNSITLNFFGNDFRIQKPLLDIVETKARDRTFAVRIYVPVLISKVKNFDNFNKDKIYTFIGEIPLMTDRGTFVVNGCERVIVNQIVRSPGIYYKRSFTTTRYNCSATLIPFRGGWLGFEIEHKYKKEETRPVCTVSFNKIQKVDLAKFLTLIGIKSSKIHSYFLHPEFFDCIETVEVVDQVGFNSQIFDSKYFNLGHVGRFKLNQQLDLNIPITTNELTKQDLVIIIDGLINLFYGEGETDDIDHLKNRRVRSVGELLQTQFRSGLMRFERILSERMTFCDPNCIIISALVNPKPIMSMMREFFGSSQLSQFLDQTNPLAELTHKRRLSGLGPGGFNRDHVSLAVRDIHSSHYGRICPIETPEGKNAGLVSSLSSYARTNSLGFIETPFFHVIDGYVRKDQEAIYLTAEEEENLKIAPGDIKLNNKGCIINSIVTVRYKTEFVNIPVQDVQYIAVSTIQIVSAATSLIPFLEHDDANRALMGSNMQRQAVPLLYPSRPIIGTGLESQLAAEGGSAVINYCDGIVVEANSQFILIKDFKQQKKVRYDLRKYVRSNQGTCIHQRPVVWKGEYVESGQVIADGPSTEGGELALGQNILIAYMPWEGFNYEDALLINERLIYSDLFTSIHIEKYDVGVRETKTSIEQTTRDLPNVNPNALNYLDDNGIVKIGTFVVAEDILVGKVTPLEDSEEIPESRLLRAIFGEDNPGVVDSSLRVPKGSYGRVLDIRIFTRVNGDILPISTDSVIRIFLAQTRKIKVGDKMAGRHGNKGIISRILPREDMPYLNDGTAVDLILNPLGVPSRMNVGQLFEGLLGFAGENLDKRFKILPFDEMFFLEASRILTNVQLKKAAQKTKKSWIFDQLNPGRVYLTDGRYGEYFDNPITVCKSYMLKLVHQVQDKIHARATGPYSLVTQQPVGGRSRKGGQRFGEMEVWALEAFGAAYTLQELLTIKSDDIYGRNATLKSIVKGLPIPKAGIPESFKVLLLELQALGLDIGVYNIQKNNFGQTCITEIDVTEKNLSNNQIPIYQLVEIH